MKLAIVSCTQKTKEEFKSTPLGKSIKKLLLLQQIDEYLVYYENKDGISKCYNKAITAYKNLDTQLIFCHDDLYIQDSFLKEKLEESFKKYDVVEVVGANQFDISKGLNGPTKKIAWHICADQEYKRGGCLHPLKNNDESLIDCSFINFGMFKECIVLDGLFIAVNPDKINDIKFDEKFEWDFYDVSFSLDCHLSGLKLGTSPIAIHHCSHGAGLLTKQYDETQKLFVKKYSKGK